MITPAGNFKFYVATKPVNFRKGMDGLASIVMNEFDLDPFSGAIFIFRSKRSDRLKLIVWDGTGLVMTYKRKKVGVLSGRGYKAASSVSTNRSLKPCSKGLIGSVLHRDTPVAQ